LTSGFRAETGALRFWRLEREGLVNALLVFFQKQSAPEAPALQFPEATRSAL
jgi:hypothetical protein